VELRFCEEGGVDISCGVVIGGGGDEEGRHSSSSSLDRLSVRYRLGVACTTGGTL
jgi:hypothetical protein